MFIRKPHLNGIPDVLATIVQDLNDFLEPLVINIAGKGAPPGKWSAEVGWISYKAS